MFKVVFGLCVYLLLSFSVALATSIHLNLSDEDLAMQGYDAVSYFDEKPLEGHPELSVNHQGVTYRFANEINRGRFVLEPGRYLPAYGGWCAWAMLDGKKVRVNPGRYKIIGGVNYLFYDAFWGNTLKKWNKKAESEGEANCCVTTTCVDYLGEECPYLAYGRGIERYLFI